VFGHEYVRLAFDGSYVAMLDEQPVSALAAVAITTHTHEHPASMHALAFHHEFQFALAQLLLGRGLAFRRPQTPIPKLHGAPAVLAVRNRAFEIAIVERVILHLDREPLVARIG